MQKLQKHERKIIADYPLIWVPWLAVSMVPRWPCVGDIVRVDDKVRIVTAVFTTKIGNEMLDHMNTAPLLAGCGQLLPAFSDLHRYEYTHIFVVSPM